MGTSVIVMYKIYADIGKSGSSVMNSPSNYGHGDLVLHAVCKFICHIHNGGFKRTLQYSISVCMCKCANTSQLMELIYVIYCIIYIYSNTSTHTHTVVTVVTSAITS